MTDSNFKYWKEICGKIRPGPWIVCGPTEHAGLCYVSEIPIGSKPWVAHLGNNSFSLEHAEFIAAARTAVPELINKLEKIKEIITNLYSMNNGYRIISESTIKEMFG